MRTLVEQTADSLGDWIQRLSAAATDLGLPAQAREEVQWLASHSPLLLMGGKDPGKEWDLHPERPAILVGTQDMLLSRALNRGYGMSRYRWPMHFSLINNDCLWVIDETQLMGVGLETSTQLQGLRHGLGTAAETKSWWMSATLDENRLGTVDFPRPPAGWPTEALSAAELSEGRPRKLVTAEKKLARAPIALTSSTRRDYGRELADLIVAKHRPGTLTLVVVNRVSRAQEVFAALVAGKRPRYPAERVALVHSRLRPMDRDRHTRLLLADGDRIVIATQTVEAGVDVSARVLITELAPWSSLVQRLGRCNRRAEHDDAEVLWVDIAADPRGDLVLPYRAEELDGARTALVPLTNGSPQALQEVIVAERPVIRPVLRRRDLVDLFDTTPDLCGQDLDVSRYIRDGADSDVEFYWRVVDDERPGPTESEPVREELCRVSLGAARDFLKKKSTRAWRWNPLSEVWEAAEAARPGDVYLVDVASGGYDDQLGWTGDSKDRPTPCSPVEDAAKEGYRQDFATFPGFWQTLEEHTGLVVGETDALATTLAPDFGRALHLAAVWHDVGKAHEEFQKSLGVKPDQAGDAGVIYAKSPNQPPPAGDPNRGRPLRHELASAIAWLIAGPSDLPERDLVAYLVAAHHGKVRLSIRSLPDEAGNPEEPEKLFARGIWDDDFLPAVPLGELTTQRITLDLSFMKMGEGPRGPSWLARTTALRDRLGPFRLAYLETVLRAADARASRLTP